MVSGPWLSSSGAGRQSSGSGNRRLANLSCRHQPGGGQFLRSQAGEQLGHRRLACRMTGCFLDDLPQAVPRSGMGALIDDEDAVRAGRATTSGHANRVLPRRRPGPPEIS